MRAIDSVSVLQSDSDVNFFGRPNAPQAVQIRFEARSFLYKQVRVMVGALVRVGLGLLPPESIAEIMLARDPHIICRHCAPAAGLYLLKVDY